MKFADIKNDVAFRKIFGNQKKSIVLISFLNAVLDFEGYNQIVQSKMISYLSVPRIMGENATIIVTKVTNGTGKQFIVELQVPDKRTFKKRVKYYKSMQIERGEDYPKLKPTYFVGILNFGIGFGKDYLAKHYSIEEETGQSVLSDIQHRFIQLTKFKKKYKDLETLVDKWTFFIKNAGKLSIIPENVGDEGLITAYQEADKYTWKKDELIAYDNASMREQDLRGEKELAMEQAEKRGLERGEKIGKEENRIEAVLGLYENEIPIPIPIIAKSLRIAEEIVREIIQKHTK